MDRTVEFNGTKFGKLTRRERAEITRRLLAERRKQIQENLKAAGAPPETVFEQLDTFDFEEKAIGARLFITHVNSVEGQLEVQLAGLKKLTPSASESTLDDIEMSDVESLKLAADVCGLQVGAPPAPEGDGGPAPEPTPGPSKAGTCYGE